MSKAALRALKEAVDAEEYEAALQKCDELLKECSETLEPQERFILLSTKGHVCIQLSKVDLGEKTLLEASKLVTNDIPQPQVQKLIGKIIWKIQVGNASYMKTDMSPAALQTASQGK